MTPELDIVISVYGEGRNIVATLSALAKAVATPARVLIVTTTPRVTRCRRSRSNPQPHASLSVEFVRNAAAAPMAR